MKVLILSRYPAPYRVKLFEYIKEHFEVDIFFKHSGGDERNTEWFSKGKYYLLDSKKDYAIYKDSLKHIKAYDLVAFYDYSSKEFIHLILKCQLLSIPYVINSDGVDLTKKKSFFRKVVKRVLIKKAAALLASGNYAKQYFLENGAKESNIYLHTFTTLEKSDILDVPPTNLQKKTLRDLLQLPRDKMIAIAVGRFIPLKRYGELIRAWGELEDKYVLLLIGGGSEKCNYEKIIKENNISNVIMFDYCPYKELANYYRAADVFVHPTSYDVWGLVVNEAMANGLPSVVSDRCVAGLELISNGNNGYLSLMGNEKDLCEKALIILDDQEKRSAMANNAIKAVQGYTIKNMAQKHIDVFEFVYASLHR